MRFAVCKVVPLPQSARLQVVLLRCAGLLFALLVSGSMSCKEEPREADDPGECSDAADNDLDGLFDCNDPDCYAAPACHDQGYRTEANLFDEMLGGEDQIVALCARLVSADVRSVVRDVFCVEPRPEVTNTSQLLDVLGLSFNGPGGRDAQLGHDLGNPGWSLLGHSASLSRRIISPVNPRAIVHTISRSHLEDNPGFVTTAFVRGEGFAEIITHDPVRDDLDFFIFKYDFPCAGEPRSLWDPVERNYFMRKDCTDKERFSEQVESEWTGYTLYDAEDLENTNLDCLQCHQHGMPRGPTATRSLLMFELNSMWMHWFYDNHYFFNWTENPLGMGPFHTSLQQYVQAHATTAEPLGETYAGIPNGAVYGSRPKGLEDLLEGNGFGNGFDNTAYEADGSSNGLLEDHRARGMFMAHSWNELYSMNLHGAIISPPGRGEVPFDWIKLTDLIVDYNAYRRGETDVFPDVTDVFEEASLAAVGLGVHPGLTAPEILVQACTQCHHDALNLDISRAQFKLGSSAPGVLGSAEGDYLGALNLAQLQTMRGRINLPDDHLRVMPPYRARSLNAGERASVTAWIDGVIAGLDASGDTTPPQPAIARFDLPPANVTLVPSEGVLEGSVWFNMTPEVRPSLVAMRAEPGTDESGYVEYYFEETTGSEGGDSSGWQISPRYMDLGIVPGLSYSYRVKMRDRAGNQSGWSGEGSYYYEPTWIDCAPVPADRDCDTVPDSEELDADTDGDGLMDIDDRDDDGDGIDSQTEAEDAQSFGSDPDGDGLMNWVDTNSDGDPFTDEQEGGGFTVGDPIPAYLDAANPCGNGFCDGTMMYVEETCEICPQDCGVCP